MFISASGNKITVSLWTNYRVLLHVPPDRADIPCYLYLCRVTPPRSLRYISDILSKSRLLYRGTFRGGIYIPYRELACNAVWPSGTVGISDTAYTCCCCSAYPWTFHSEKNDREKKMTLFIPLLIKLRFGFVQQRLYSKRFNTSNRAGG